MPLREAVSFFDTLQLEGARQAIAERITREIGNRLGFLVNVGLDYLSLDRSADTLSGGEAQRIRLASQVGSGLTGVMYVLDEPSIGLHQRDNARLLGTLAHLRDIGNSVIVVEHDQDAILAADHVVDMGPGAGVHGGVVVAEGTPAQVTANPASVTGLYLSGRRSIAVPRRRHSPQRVRAPVNDVQRASVAPGGGCQRDPQALGPVDRLLKPAGGGGVEHLADAAQVDGLGIGGSCSGLGGAGGLGGKGYCIVYSW
jgi:excinuclease UvrABC ATPase subunit